MSKSRIMVVDDDERYLELLEFMLTSSDYDVIAVQNPREVCARANADRPDVIVLDIAMPELDGMEVGMSLKSDPATANIPLIFVTAMSEHTQVQESKRLSAAYLTKPFAPRQLIEIIQKTLKSGKPHGVRS